MTQMNGNSGWFALPSDRCRSGTLGCPPSHVCFHRESPSSRTNESHAAEQVYYLGENHSGLTLGS